MIEGNWGERLRAEDSVNRIRNAGLTPPDPADVQPFAHLKRFLERWNGDAQFRRSFPSAPKRVAAEAGLQVDPEEVRCVWDEESRDTSSPRVERFLAFHHELERWRNARWRRAVPADPRYAAWRRRQIYRLNLEVGTSLFVNPHIPASFELARGCSVGCWFCSSSPPKLNEIFRYTPENARLWREILEAVHEVSGPAMARLSICYSGTDPFDNPDYERFLEDFAAINGDYAYTSTALPVRDPHRTRRLMAISGPHQLRFSVLSLGMLNRIHDAFTAEEMFLVQLSLRNEGSLESHLMHFAGGAREREKTYRRYRPGEPRINTPACETGFKFNLVDRSIQLSSPCAPDDRWPKGERVYDEARFNDGDDVRRILNEMMARHMPTEIEEEVPIRFQRHLHYEPTASGFHLTTAHVRQRFEDTPESPFAGKLGELVQSGRHTARQIEEILATERGASRESIRSGLADLFRLGLLDDEPVVGQSVSSAR